MKTHILAIDDSRTIRSLLTMALEKAGFDVTTAVDGVDGVSAVADQQTVVMHFPGLAGLQDQTDPGSGFLAGEVVVHRAHRQE